MKTTELRIGNLISWISSENIEKVMKIDLKYVNEVSEKDLSPIPLTEEWLLKFGFENQQIELDYPDKLLIISATVGGKYYFYLDDADGSTFGLNYIQYVHQLQNLYFILTGTELEIR